MLSRQQEERVAKEVAHCLTKCAASDRPFRQASAHIDLLHGDPHWSHDEIVEVQARVLRALLDQRRPDAEPRARAQSAPSQSAMADQR